VRGVGLRPEIFTLGTRPVDPGCHFPAGYAWTAIDLRVSGRCQVLIRGAGRMPIVGAVSMDLMMVDRPPVWMNVGAGRRSGDHSDARATSRGNGSTPARDGRGHRDDSVRDRLPGRLAN